MASASYPPHRQISTPDRDFAKDRAKLQATRLVKDARAFFSKISLQPSIPCAITGTDPFSVIKELFDSGFDHICIGERLHTDYVPKKTLMQIAPLLQSQLDVHIFFMEHLESDLLQKDLDNWTGGSPLSPVDQALSRLDQRYHLQEHPFGYTSLIYKMNAIGMRVIAIDSAAAQKASCPGSGLPDKERRIIALNYQARQVISKEKADRSIIFCGADHGTALKDTIPGIPDLIDHCAFVIFASADPFTPAGIYTDPESPQLQAYTNRHIHALIVMESV